MNSKAEYRRMAAALTADETAALLIADNWMCKASAAELERLADTITSLTEREMIAVRRNAPNGFLISNLGEWVLAAR